MEYDFLLGVLKIYKEKLVCNHAHDLHIFSTSLTTVKDRVN